MADTDKTKLLRSHLRDYLVRRGINPDKEFHCLNPEHEDKNPSMTMDQGGLFVRCWSKCGRNFSIFDLEGMRLNLTTFKEQQAAVEKFFYPTGMAGYDSTPEKRKKSSAPSPDLDKKPLFIYESILTTEPKIEEEKVSDNQVEKPPKDFSAEYIAWHADKHAAEQWESERGINHEMVERFELGFDAKRKALIVPCTSTYHAARLITPRGHQKYDNPTKPNKVQLFNESALDGTGPVWIVEGAIDAISIIQAGKEFGTQAIATHSAGNTELVINAIKERTQIPPLILCYDADEAGNKHVAKLVEYFREQNIAFFDVKIPGKGEDANSTLKRDAGALNRFIKQSMDTVRSTMAKSVEKTSFKHHLKQYQMRKTPNIYLPTGFPALDKVINGGLHAGYLIVLGAQPSLGKTTLVLQMANNIAEQGNLVIFFSLEQSINELLEKSISMKSGRILDQNSVKVIAADNPDDPIQSDNYSDVDTKIQTYINASDRVYGYSDNLHAIGIEDAGNTAQIREHVFKLMSITGKTPLVIIDHLQIIGATDGFRQDRRGEIDQIVKEINMMTKHFQVPTLVISKLSRQSNDTDIRESGFMESNAIEYSADLSLALQFECLDPNSPNRPNKDEHYNPDLEKMKHPRKMQLKVMKQRGGAGGERINLNYYAKFNEFEEIGQVDYFTKESAAIPIPAKNYNRKNRASK